MRLGLESLCLIFLFSAFSSLALPQAVAPASDGINSIGNFSPTTRQQTTAPLSPPTGSNASEAPATPSVEQTSPWDIAIYPALAWVPVFGSGMDLPPAPSHPDVPVSGSTNSALNGAYFGGARIEKNKWSVDALFMWAALSASRQTPHTNLDLDFVFGDAMVGRELVPDLYLECGFRRVALNITATVDTDSASASPGYWDPLIGLTYRKQLGKKWRILIHGDGGGFGVGSDVDVSATGRAEWKFARHFGITMGYGGMHFSDSTDSGKLTVSPTLHGPIFGFGTYF